MRTTLVSLLLLGNLGCVTSIDLPAGTSGEWQPYTPVPGGFRRQVVGDPLKPGFFRFQLKVPAGARVEAHQHSIPVHVRVLSGSMHIIVDEPLDRTRAQHYAAGTAFVIPAEAWHVEWWDEPTMLEGEGLGPMITTRRHPLRDSAAPPQSERDN